MPTVFNSYPTALLPGFAGMLATQDTSRRISRTVDGSSVPIPFGAAVFTGTTPRSCSADAADGKFLGVAIADPAQPVASNGAYVEGSTAGIMTAGEIWVQLGADAVVAGAVAYYVAATGVFTDAAAAGANPRIGQFVTAGPINGIALLRLDPVLPATA
jgi:PDZ domain-containing secreted protein